MTGTTLDKKVRAYFSAEVKFEQSLKEVRKQDMCPSGENVSIPGRGNSRCQGPGVGISLEFVEPIK